MVGSTSRDGRSEVALNQPGESGISSKGQETKEEKIVRRFGVDSVFTPLSTLESFREPLLQSESFKGSLDVFGCYILAALDGNYLSLIFLSFHF